MKAAVLLGLLALPASLLAQSSEGPRRLVGQAYYISSAPGGYRLHDSAHYSYSGQRGSRYDPNFLLYTDLQTLGSQPDADMVNQRAPTHNIDSVGLPRADYDSAYFAIGLGEAPPNSFLSYEGHRYGPGGELTQVFSRVYDPVSGSQQYGQQSVEIYSAGRLIRSYILGFGGSGYDTSFIRDYSYDGAGRLVMDSLSYRLTPGSYVGYRRVSYAYASGTGPVSTTLYSFKPSPSRLEPATLDSMSYYPDGRLQTRKSFFLGDSGNFLPESLDSFGYTAGVSGFDYLREEDLDTLGNPVYSYFTVAERINSRGQKDSVSFTAFRGTTSLGSSRVSIVYDTAGYPLSRSDYFSNTGPAPYTVEYYYYEPVPQAENGVAAVRPALDFTLAPNPCTETLYYSLAGIPAGTGICLEVLSMGGQLVHRETRSWSGSPQALILGPEAPPGSYALRISEPRSGTCSSRQFTRL